MADPGRKREVPHGKSSIWADHDKKAAAKKEDCDGNLRQRAWRGPYGIGSLLGWEEIQVPTDGIKHGVMLKPRLFVPQARVTTNTRTRNPMAQPDGPFADSRPQRSRPQLPLE